MDGLRGYAVPSAALMAKPTPAQTGYDAALLQKYPWAGQGGQFLQKANEIYEGGGTGWGGVQALINSMQAPAQQAVKQGAAYLGANPNALDDYMRGPAASALQAEAQNPLNLLSLAAKAGIGGAAAYRLMNKAPLRWNPNVAGMNTWHGGPNKWMPEPGFPHGRPRLDKMGTGEGAQAYGWGFYSADAKGVATDYKDNLSRGLPETKYKGKVIPETEGPEFFEQGFTLEDRMARTYSRMDNPQEAAQNQIDYLIRRQEMTHAGESTAADIPPSVRERMIEGMQEEIDAIRAVDFNAIEKLNPGTLYKIDLPDDAVAKYLDWDAPLSEQPEAVRRLMKKYDLEPGELTGRGPLQTPVLGKEIYKHLEQQLGSDRAASEALRKAGIPGLKYFDAGSRPFANLPIEKVSKSEWRLHINPGLWHTFKTKKAAKAWAKKNQDEGTRNFVTWDQDVLDRTQMLEQNGEKLPAMLRGYHGTGEKDFALEPRPIFLTEDVAGASTYADYHRQWGGNDFGDIKEFDVSAKKIATMDDVQAAAKKAGFSADEIGSSSGYELVDGNVDQRAYKVLDLLKADGFDAARVSDFSRANEFDEITSLMVFDPAKTLTAKTALLKGGGGSGTITPSGGGGSLPSDVPGDGVSRPLLDYPITGPPETKINEKGNEFLSKVLTPEAKAVQKKVNAAQKDINAGNYTPYFDLSKRFDVDPSNYDFTPSTLENAVPKAQKAIDKYTKMAANKTGKKSWRDAYAKGLKMENSEDWFFMGQLEDKFIEVYGEVEGRKQFDRKFAHSMAAMTGGSSPKENFRNAMYGNYMNAQGLSVPEEGWKLPYPVGGRYLGTNMRMFNRFAGTNLDAKNPKRRNFRGNFLGEHAATLDEQMMKGFDPKGPGEPPGPSYGYYERTLNDLAAKKNVDPSAFQDVAWAGLKSTKDKTYTKGKPMMQEVNEAIERTARVTGLTPEEVVVEGIVKSRIPIYGIAGATVAAGTILALMQDAEGQI